MSLLDDFRRVDFRHSCPLCGKPDWCLVAREPVGNPWGVVCARVQSGVRWGEAGWLHRLHDAGGCGRSGRSGRSLPTYESGVTGPELDQYDRDLDHVALRGLAGELSLSTVSLQALQIGWNGWAWTFPMRDDRGELVGVRLRRPDGRKLAVRGSKNGLFLPRTMQGTDPLLVCEGPTDAAAMLDLGFDAVGRPSCTAGTKFAVRLVQARRPGQVVLLADRDRPGQRGASELATRLRAYCPDVRLVTPPHGYGDARAWRAGGATRHDVQSQIESAEPLSLSLRSGGGQ